MFAYVRDRGTPCAEGLYLHVPKGKRTRIICNLKELQEEELSLRKTCGWSLSDGYMDLARELKDLKASGVIHNPFQ